MKRKMIPFDLSKVDENGKVKDGYEVVYRNGSKPLRVIHVPEAAGELNMLAIDGSGLVWWHYTDGKVEGGIKGHDLMLLCPEPKMLSGFVNVYPGTSEFHQTRELADEFAVRTRIACIDLSQFEEGHGL